MTNIEGEFKQSIKRCVDLAQRIDDPPTAAQVVLIIEAGVGCLVAAIRLVKAVWQAPLP